MADSLANRNAAELLAFAAKIRRVAGGEGDLDLGERATAALTATAIDNYLATGEDWLPDLLHECEVIAQAQSSVDFDWLTALFQLKREEG